MAKVNFVEIKFQDFFLAQTRFNPYRQQDFPQFAQHGFFAAQEKIAGDLHGDGAAALPFLAGSQKREGCP